MPQKFMKDSGLSWVICLGSSGVCFLESGVLKSLGVLLPALRSEFSTQTWEIGLLISLSPAYGAIACLIAGASRKKVSPRVFMIACGILSSLGLIMASYSRSIPTLAISFILTGFSFGAEAMAIAVLQDYFDEYYDAATTIVTAGLSIGIMVMPLLTQFLLQVYGWRGALLVIGGLNCHIIVCGALIRPVQSMEPDNNNESDERGQRELTFPDINRILDFKLFKNLTFISLLCINFGKGNVYNSWLIYVVPHSLDTGFQPYQASTIATVGGVGRLVGSLTFLLVVQKLSKQTIIYLSICLASLSLGIDPLLTASHAYVGLMLTSLTLNMGITWLSCVIYSALGGIVEEDEYCSAVNYLFAIYSMGFVTSGFFTGWLFDVYGNYTMSYLVLSAVAMMSLIPLTLVNIKDCIKQHVYKPVLSDDPGR